MRKFHVVEEHIQPCALCGQRFELGDEVYMEPDVPDSPADRERAKRGLAHAVRPQLAHLKCNPRAESEGFNDAWKSGTLG